MPQAKNIITLIYILANSSFIHVLQFITDTQYRIIQYRRQAEITIPSKYLSHF